MIIYSLHAFNELHRTLHLLQFFKCLSRGTLFYSFFDYYNVFIITKDNLYDDEFWKTGEFQYFY